MHPGDIVAGKYRVQKILGRTGGLLLEARHTEFDQRVVIRMLAPSLCDDKEIESFRREARTLSKLESEHVARIIDVGTHSDGSFFLVRQYLEGIDLATHLKNQGALRLDEAVLYILQASEAVQECHSQKIVLRELRPAHLFVTKKRGGTPLVKVIDFGTAKLLKDPGSVPVGEATATVMLGMSPYSSPELVRKQPIDARTDVWSLGCILYELLAAVPPFQGDMAELMMQITRDEPMRLSRLRPDIPRELDQIISWALAKDLGSRFSSVYALAHALKPFASTEGHVLIDQIGRLAHAKSQAGGTGQISPTSPLAKRSSHAPYSHPDEATVMRPMPSRGGQETSGAAERSGRGAVGADRESDFERTAFLPESYASSPTSSRGSYPPPAATSNATPRAGVPADSGARGSVPPPRPMIGSRPGVSGSWSSLAIDPDPAGSPYSGASSTGAYPAASAVQTRRRQRKVAILAFGMSLVLLPVLVTVLVFALRRPHEGGPEVTDGDRPSAPAAKLRDDADEDDAAPSSIGSAQASPSTEVEDTTAPKPSAAFTAPTASPNWPPAPTVRSAKPEPAKPDPIPEPEPESTGGKTGTLVAIAIGGSCGFAVDGVPKGTKSSIRLQVPVGPHMVSCAPPGKATRTQRVNVKDNKPGIASFRLN